MPDDYYVSQYSGEEIDERLTAAHNAVRYDAAQTLTDAQKAQARNNISAMQGIESTDHPGCNYVLNGSTVEWVNPPMLPGVEYRTTERYLGKPVYVQAVSVGGLAAATEKIVVVKSSGCKDVIRAYAIGTDSVDNRRLTPNNDTDDCTFHCSAMLYKTQADQSVFLVLEASRALTDVVAVAYYTKVAD